MKRSPILHPFLFALYPVAALYAYNAGQVALADTARPALVALAAAGALLLAFGALVKDMQRGGLAASAVLLLFSSYGHIFNALMGRYPRAFFSQTSFLLPFWIAVMVLSCALFLRVVKGPAARGWTVIFNAASAAALAMTAVTIGLAWARDGLPLAAPAPSVQASAPAEAVPDAPDIYYFVVDTYGRPDVLSELFGEDQHEFLEFLSDQGFVVAEQSAANYPQTLLSMGSSLNMDFIDRLIPIRAESDNRLPLNRLVAKNEAARFLKQRGYRTVFIASSFFDAHGMEADVFLSPVATGLTTFERLALEGTLLVVYEYDLPAERLRRAYEQSLEMLRAQAVLPGPKFVVYYTTLLHTPFVFDRDGNPIEPLGSMTESPSEAYFAGYPGQLAYTNRVLREAVADILAQSERPPVIVIQGDHGTGVTFHFNDLESNACLRERFGIMNAYYLPGVEEAVYQTITPVNTFRVIFNAYFDAGFELLPDRSYYATWLEPYQFTDITGRVQEACDLPAAP